MNKFSKILLPAMALLLIILTNCDDRIEFLSPQDQLEKDQGIIDRYLEKRNIQAEIEPVYGLRHVIHNQGTGSSPVRSSVIKVNYEGRLLDGGKVFDEGDTVEFNLDRLIGGWQIGIPLISEGGSITLYVPSGYGYGQRGAGSDIPANANLIFDIDLIEVVE